MEITVLRKNKVNKGRQKVCKQIQKTKKTPNQFSNKPVISPYSTPCLFNSLIQRIGKHSMYTQESVQAITIYSRFLPNTLSFDHTPSASCITSLPTISVDNQIQNSLLSRRISLKIFKLSENISSCQIHWQMRNHQLSWITTIVSCQCTALSR